MLRLQSIGSATLLAALLFSTTECLAQSRGRLVVEHGFLTPEQPFGICPVTRKARTASDFYSLFGFIPESSGVKYPGVPSKPPKNWPTPYWTPTAAQVKQMAADPWAPYRPASSAAAAPAVASVSPKTSVTPLKNSVPQQSTTSPKNNSTVPPKNTVPAATSTAQPKPAPVKPVAVQPPKNVSPSRSNAPLTSAEANQVKGQLRTEQVKLIDEISQHVNNAPDPQRRAALQETLNRVRGRVDSGNVTGQDINDLANGIRNSLPAADQGPALQAVGQIAANQQVQRWIDGNGGANAGAVAGGNNARGNTPAAPGTGGRLGAGNTVGGPGGNPPEVANTGGRRLNMNNAAGGAGGNAPADPGTGGRLGMGNAAGGAGGNRPTDPGTGGRLGAGNAAGGAGPLAMGEVRGGGVGNAPMALMPFLPAGLVIPLPFNQGNGAFLVGMGQPEEDLLIGTGDPDMAAGLLVAPPDAPPALEPIGIPTAGETVLTNTAKTPVQYTVNRSDVTMRPDEEQTLPAGSSWVVEFQRGNNRGVARYQLEAGYYEFRYSANGWDLFKKNFMVTLDNVGGQNEFSYVIDNRTETLGAGQKQELTGLYPPVVRFDNGVGEIRERELTAFRYRIALDEDRTFDIFPADSVPLPQAAAQTPSGSDAIPPAPRSRIPGDAAPSETEQDDLPPRFQPFDVTAAITVPAPDAAPAPAPGAPAAKSPAAKPRIPPGFGLFEELSGLRSITF